MDPNAYNAWRLASLTALPIWALGLLCVLLLATLAFTWTGLVSEPVRRRRVVLVSLRALTLVGLFVLLLEPGLELRAETRVRARIALLVDTSKSMRFPSGAPEGGSRMQELLRFLSGQTRALQELAARFQVDVYGFDKETSLQDVARLLAAPDPLALSQGPTTELLPALTQAAQGSSGGRPLAGIFVASDGADHGELSQGLSAQVKQELERLHAPIFALPLGGEAQKDLAIEQVRVDDFAFVRSPLTLDVTLSSRGLPKRDVPLVLRREGQIVAQTTAHLGADGETQVRLTFVPDHTGKFAFTLSVPVYEGEALVENNQRSFVLKVIRDRVRALLVVGRPSWDVRFLRQLLTKDPNVDLISFFILRTPGDDTRSSQDELSLIPFPTQEIFQEQLRTFDLVIFQNFNHRPYHMSQYLDGIAQYVREGGALAMIGGDDSFSAGDYAGTAIEDVLPVQLLPPGSTSIDETPAQLQLTDLGQRHPITELVPGAAQNDALWKRLPKLPGLNALGASKALAQTLVRSADGRPVLVVSEIGQGRSLALATDASWLWSFLAAGQELGPRAYETFWHGAIRWLVKDPALTPMRLTAERPIFEPGEPITLDASVRGPDYQPAADAQLTLQIISSEGAGAPPGGPQVSSTPTMGPTTGSDGTARLKLLPLPPGAYKVIATARKADGAVLAVSEEAFVIAPTSLEQSDPKAHPELLSKLVQATGGRLVKTSEALTNLPWRDPELVEVGQRTTRPLWDTLWVLLALCALVATEWSLRRRWGYA